MTYLQAVNDYTWAISPTLLRDGCEYLKEREFPYFMQEFACRNVGKLGWMTQIVRWSNLYIGFDLSQGRKDPAQLISV